MGKREPFAFTLFVFLVSCDCYSSVLFLTVCCVSLLCVIVVFVAASSFLCATSVLISVFIVSTLGIFFNLAMVSMTKKYMFGWFCCIFSLDVCIFVCLCFMMSKVFL